MAHAANVDMTAATSPLRRAGSRVGVHWPWVTALVGLVVFAALVAASLHHAVRERNALLRMDPADRRAFYDTTERNAEAVCRRADADEAFRSRCEDAVSFSLKFPECDATCQALALRWGHEASR